MSKWKWTKLEKNVGNCWETRKRIIFLRLNSIPSKRDPVECDVAYHKSCGIYAQRSAFPNSEKVEPESI